MRNLVVIIAGGFLASCAYLPGMHSDDVSDKDRTSYAAAVADTSRPTTDSARDVDRKPAETLAFVHVKAGDKLADFGAGGGYFTRLFADVVGPKGRVYAIEPGEVQKMSSVSKNTAELQTFAATHPNVTVNTAPALEALKFPEPLDLFWISQNYHDLKDKFFGPVDTAAFNKAVFAALKPGGVYIVLDHAAAAGAPADVTETLHRIDPAVVRREVEAAGFQYEGESTILANPKDPHTVKVFDPSIRGKTDQFIYKFRKPKH
jgi:predicted methyltransferase